MESYIPTVQRPQINAYREFPPVWNRGDERTSSQLLVREVDSFSFEVKFTNVSCPVKIAVEPVTARPDTPVPNLAQTMLDEERGDLVIAEDERPVGIVTDRDIALAVARDADLGVLGRHGLPDTGHHIGSVSDRVVDNSTQPVYLL
jgi:nucleotide-binding universal stress UspA family protein